MHSPWRLDGRLATLRLGPLEACVDLNHPELGLDQLSLAGQSIAPAHILGVVLPTDRRGSDRFVEAYVRGNDLIASYTESTQPAFRWQIYWRAYSARFPAALAAVEAIVSVQTDQLDSQPKLNLLSWLPIVSGLFWHANGSGQLELEPVDPEAPVCSATAEQGWSCFGVRVPQKSGTYVELVHPDDFTWSGLYQLRDEFPDGTTLSHVLFEDGLEKGVIRRSRVLALFLPELPTTEGIAAFRRLLMDEALPLTT